MRLNSVSSLDCTDKIIDYDWWPCKLGKLTTLSSVRAALLQSCILLIHMLKLMSASLLDFVLNVPHSCIRSLKQTLEISLNPYVNLSPSTLQFNKVLFLKYRVSSKADGQPHVPLLCEVLISQDWEMEESLKDSCHLGQ